MREPGQLNFSAAFLLAELLHAGIVGLRRSVLFCHLETGERNRSRFIGYVDDPQESWRRHFQSDHILVGDQHDAPSAHRKWYRQCRMRRPRKGRAPVQPGDELRLRHVVDAEDNEPAVPVTGVQTIADPYRMMAAMGRALPARLLAPGTPLPRHPPAANFLRLGRVIKVDDSNDVTKIAVEFGRAIDVAAIEGETVHTMGRPGCNVSRL